MQTGNIITKIDGKKVDSFDVLSDALYKKTKDDKAILTISYLKNNKYEEKEVTVSFK